MPAEELDRREKELISIAASVAAGCQPCTAHHVREAREAGASASDLRLAVDDALCVRRNSTDVIALHAASLLGDEVPARAACCGEKGILRELASVAAAFAVNCPVNLADHTAAARRAGASERQVQTAIGMARSIKRVAASHVEDAADPSLAAADSGTAEALATPGCGCAAARTAVAGESPDVEAAAGAPTGMAR